MDPQVKSVATTVALAVVAWAAGKGLVIGDQAGLANALVTIGGVVVAGLIGWWKARQVSQTSMIQEVNKGNNGVKVVAASEPAQAVDQPLKGK